MDLHAWITKQVDAIEKADPPHSPDCESLPQARSCCGAEECYCGADDTFPCNCAAPAAVLRRCEADRRILARHQAWADSGYCEGCDQDLTTNINDCAELLDLAHAHGITPDIAAGLDRPHWKT